MEVLPPFTGKENEIHRVRQLMSQILYLTSKLHVLSAKSGCLLYPTVFWITWVSFIEPLVYIYAEVRGHTFGGRFPIRKIKT